MYIHIYILICIKIWLCTAIPACQLETSQSTPGCTEVDTFGQIGHHAGSHQHACIYGCTYFTVQGYLAHKEPPLVGPYSCPMPRGPMVILWGWVFPMSEVPLQSQREFARGRWLPPNRLGTAVP